MIDGTAAHAEGQLGGVEAGPTADSLKGTHVCGFSIQSVAENKYHESEQGPLEVFSGSSLQEFQCTT
jgi:hypothetical protein